LGSITVGRCEKKSKRGGLGRRELEKTASQGGRTTEFPGKRGKGLGKKGENDKGGGEWEYETERKLRKSRMRFRDATTKGG